MKVARVGWHRWSNASGEREYLGALHRHTFYVSAEIDVAHDDRDIEFHDLRDVVCEWWGDERDQFDRGSCEQLAGELYHVISAKLPGRRPVIHVSEDGEAWAKVKGTGDVSHC